MRAALGLKPLKMGTSSSTKEREASEKKRFVVSSGAASLTTDRPADRPAGRPTDRPTDRPADRPADLPTDECLF